MGRLDWSAIRLVAESISYGGRSRWNMLKIPELSFGQAREAISELERNGMVSVTDDRVEPTEAFGSWFADLRRRDDAAHTTGAAVQVVQKASSANELLTADGADGNRVSRGPRKKPNTAALAVRILERLAGRRLNYLDVGHRIPGEMPMGKLRRALNAYRMNNWVNALELCKHYGAISIDQSGVVKLLVMPVRLFPTPPPPPRKSAGRYRSEKELAERRAWVMKKRLEGGEDLEENEDDEPRDDIKDWVAEQRLKQQTRPPAPAE
jgi:hypothetical protein